jgi:hypothetical protein
MQILGVENKTYFARIEISLTNKFEPLGRINLTARWKTVAKFLKNNFLGVKDTCELMYIEVIDTFYNPYGQETCSYAIVYGRKLEDDNSGRP